MAPELFQHFAVACLARKFLHCTLTLHALDGANMAPKNGAGRSIWQGLLAEHVKPMNISSPTKLAATVAGLCAAGSDGVMLAHKIALEADERAPWPWLTSVGR